MEKNGKYKMLAVGALVVSVLALAVGFASFTQTLSITNASTTVKANDTFSPNLKFKASSMSCANKSATSKVISSGSVSDTAWSGINVELNNPGDFVECTATVENASSFIAYLNEINSASVLTCSGGATAQGIDKACEGMKVTVTVGSDSAEITSTTPANLSVNNNTIAAKSTANGEQEVKVKIEYLTGSSQADSDFEVSIPQINLVYDTEEK